MGVKLEWKLLLWYMCVHSFHMSFLRLLCLNKGVQVFQYGLVIFHDWVYTLGLILRQEVLPKVTLKTAGQSSRSNIDFMNSPLKSALLAPADTHV